MITRFERVCLLFGFLAGALWVSLIMLVLWAWT